MNGVSVNAVHLKALVPFKLRDQDIVVLSVADTGLATGQFVYRFYASLKVRHRPFSPRLKVRATAGCAAPWDGQKDAGGISVGRCVSLAARFVRLRSVVWLILHTSCVSVVHFRSRDVLNFVCSNVVMYDSV